MNRPIQVIIKICYMLKIQHMSKFFSPCTSSWCMDGRKKSNSFLFFLEKCKQFLTFPTFGVVYLFIDAEIFLSFFSLYEHGDDICIIILEYILRYIITNGIIIVSTVLYVTNAS